MTQSPAAAVVRREQSNRLGAAAVPELCICTAAGTRARCHQRGLGGTQRRRALPEAQVSGGPSTALGTAASERVSSFPLWSALGLTAKAPARPCLLLSFFSYRRFHLGRTRGLEFGSGHCIGGWVRRGSQLNSALFRLFLSQVTQEGGHGTAVSDSSSWDMG